MKGLVKYTSMKKLILKSFQESFNSLEFLKDLIWLESISIFSAKHSLVTIPNIFKEMKDLKEIHLRGFINDFLFLLQMKKLEFLHLDSCMGFLDSGIFKNTFSNIKYLEINNIPPKFQSGIFSAFPNLKHFKYLPGSGAHYQIKTNGLKRISKMRDLEYLMLSSSFRNRIDSDFLKNLTMLKRLNIRLLDLSNYRGTEFLEEVIYDMDYQHNLSPEFLINSSKSLKKLELRSKSEFSMEILEKFENIEEISLNVFSPISYDTIYLFKHLKSLMIYSTKSIKIKGLTIPYLKVIYTNDCEIQGTVDHLVLVSFGNFDILKNLVVKQKLELQNYQNEKKEFDMDILKNRDLKYFIVENEFPQLTFNDLVQKYPNIKFIKNTTIYNPEIDRSSRSYLS